MARSFSRSPGRTRPPLGPASLEALAIHYVGRYATTRAKLATYLTRKLGERGWDGDSAPDPAAVAERCAALGYIDDRSYATATASSLARRGFGARRVRETLRIAGIEATDAEEAQVITETEKLPAALALARRRRIGPFAAAPPGREEVSRAINILLRAGHDFALARRVAAARPGEDIGEE